MAATIAITEALQLASCWCQTRGEGSAVVIAAADPAHSRLCAGRSGRTVLPVATGTECLLYSSSGRSLLTAR